jgi:ABC-type uncharacterized transport system involved in gliding motility auxiliary subunit
MKPEWRRYAPFGLYLSGLAVIASIGLYIYERQVNLPVQIALALIVLGLAAFLLLDPDRVRRAFSGRQARYGSNALVLSIAVLGIVGVVNYVVFNNTWRWDLTEDKQNTLAAETTAALEKLSQPVQAKAFFTARTSSTTAKALLDQFKTASQGKFTYEFVDPESDPVAAQSANITQDGTVVLYMGDRSQPARSVSEGELINAIARLENPQAATVYFLTGHGEYSPDDTGDKSYSRVKATLENRNYTVKTLNLLAANAVPEDAKLLVIAGPRDALSGAEVDLIRQFQEKGGSLIVLEEPTITTNIGDAADPLVDYLQQTWGITVGNDIVVDLTSQQPYAPYAASYGSSPITQPIERSATQFPTARTVRASAANTGVSQVELVLTAQQSWAETDLAALKDGQSQPQFDQNTDQAGPVPLAVAAENLTSKARVVVIGDSDFVIDANYPAYANGSFFSYAVDWTVGQENLINISPKTPTQRMVVPPQAAVMNLIFLGTVILLPLLALIGGVVVFVQRRRRG